MQIDDIADAIVRILKDYGLGRLPSHLVDEEFKLDTGLVLSGEIEKLGGYDNLDVALRSSRRRAYCTRSGDDGCMEYCFLSNRFQTLNEPPQNLLQTSISLKQSPTAIKDNGSHAESQIKTGLEHGHRQSYGPDHSLTIRQDDSKNDRGKLEKGKYHSQSNEVEGKSLDRPQISVPSSHSTDDHCVGDDSLVAGVKKITLDTHGNNGTQKKCLKAEESSVAAKENDTLATGQVEQEQQHCCQRQGEEGTSLDSSKDALPSIRLEDSGGGSKKTPTRVAIERIAKGIDDRDRDEEAMTSRQLDESSERNRTEEVAEVPLASDVGSEHRVGDVAGGDFWKQTVPTGDRGYGNVEILHPVAVTQPISSRRTKHQFEKSAGSMTTSGHGRGRGRMCTLPAWKTRENDDLNLSESSPLTNGDKKSLQQKQSQNDYQPSWNQSKAKPAKAPHTFSGGNRFDSNNNNSSSGYTNTNTFVEAKRSNDFRVSSETPPLPARGRGISATLPAWMTNGEGNSSPTTSLPDRNTSSLKNPGSALPPGLAISRKDSGTPQSTTGGGGVYGEQPDVYAERRYSTPGGAVPLKYDERTELQLGKAKESLPSQQIRRPIRGGDATRSSAVPNGGIMYEHTTASTPMTPQCLGHSDPPQPIVVKLTELQRKLLHDDNESSKNRNNTEFATLFRDIDAVENSSSPSPERCESWTMLGCVDKSVPVYLNTSEPFFAITVGEEGAGSNQTVGCLIEGCVLSTQSKRLQLRNEKVQRLDIPKKTVIFQYDQDILSYPDISSIVKNGNIPDIEPLEGMVIFVSPRAFHSRREYYHGIEGLEGVEVVPLYFNKKHLSRNERMWVTGDFDNAVPTFEQIEKYEHEIRIVSSKKNFFDWFFPELSYGVVDTSLLFHSMAKKKDLIIIDLIDQSEIGPKQASGIFSIILSQLQNEHLMGSSYATQEKLLILNEAQNYMSTHNNGKLVQGPLETVVLSVLRRSQTNRFSTILSTQSPQTIPRNLLTFMTLCIVHRFYDSNGYSYLKPTVRNMPSFEDVISLETGEAILYAPKVDSQMRRMGTVHKTRIRNRLTGDGKLKEHTEKATSS